MSNFEKDLNRLLKEEVRYIATNCKRCKAKVYGVSVSDSNGEPPTFNKQVELVAMCDVCGAPPSEWTWELMHPELSQEQIELEFEKEQENE